MANSPSSFERMVRNNGPVQTSIMQNLTRWELRNLQLAGIRISGNRLFHKKNLIADRCSEWDLERGEQCIHTTKSFDEIRAWSGYPVHIPEKGSITGKWIGGDKIQSCLRNEHDQVNTKSYPIHKKICRVCRDVDVATHRDAQSRKIAGFRTPLCKRHSREHANQSPLDACRCLDYINHEWRCWYCCYKTLRYLVFRARIIGISLRKKKIPWTHPWAWFKSLWASNGPMCPIEGCFQIVWLDEASERMYLCKGCSRICKD